MALHESGEMYIETIYLLSKTSAHVRAIDVCAYMGFSKPSVSRGMSVLKKEGFVFSDDDGFLFLTDSGLEIALKIYERHTIVAKILVALGVDRNIAEEDACRIEHILSDESFDAIKKYAHEHL